VRSDDRPFAEEALRRFFLPYLAIRNRRRGYAVSIVKAGLRVVGRPAGPVRAPLLDLTSEEEASLAGLVRYAQDATAAFRDNDGDRTPAGDRSRNEAGGEFATPARSPEQSAHPL
jgi:hypothetical protein